MENYYETLGLKPFADISEIKRIFRKLAKQYHPDMQEGGDREKFEQIRTTYEILKSDSSRKSYNQTLKYLMAQAKEDAKRAQLGEIDSLTKLDLYFHAINLFHKAFGCRDIDIFEDMSKACFIEIFGDVLFRDLRNSSWNQRITTNSRHGPSDFKNSEMILSS